MRTWLLCDLYKAASNVAVTLLLPYVENYQYHKVTVLLVDLVLLHDAYATREMYNICCSCLSV